MVKALAFQPSFGQGPCFSTIIWSRPLLFNHGMVKALAFQPWYGQGPCFSTMVWSRPLLFNHGMVKALAFQLSYVQKDGIDDLGIFTKHGFTSLLIEFARVTDIDVLQ
jgi:hypothetical protein